jgi:hypothetical protein
MSTLLELPDDLLGAVERRAERDGRDLASTVADLLWKGLEAPMSLSQATSGRVTTDPRTGLPRVVCKPGAPVESMTIEEILAMEHQTLLEDDLERHGLPVRHEPVDRAELHQPPAPSRDAA